MVGALQPLGPLAIGQHHPAADHADPVGHFLAGRKPVDQRRTAARHHDAHVGDDPVGGVARRDPDAVALHQFVLAEQSGGDMARGIVSFAKGQTASVVDQEFGVLMLVAVMREIVRQAGRGALERGHGDAVARERHGFRWPAGGNQRVGNGIQCLIELSRHAYPLSSIARVDAARCIVPFVWRLPVPMQAALTQEGPFGRYL